MKGERVGAKEFMQMGIGIVCLVVAASLTSCAALFLAAMAQ